MNDIRYRKGNDKRAAQKANKWLPANGEQLQIPYEIAPDSYKDEIEGAIKTMNNILHCHKQAWVPRTSKHSHYIRFIKKDGYEYFYIIASMPGRSKPGRSIHLFTFVYRHKSLKPLHICFFCFC